MSLDPNLVEVDKEMQSTSIIHGEGIKLIKGHLFMNNAAPLTGAMLPLIE
jgi:hypothetical protein